MVYGYITFIIGIGIVVVALFLIKKDSYNNSKYKEFLYEKENELLRNIEIAEDIIKELNEVSDGIIDQLDKKVSEINKLLHQVENLPAKSVSPLDAQRITHENTERNGIHNTVIDNKAGEGQGLDREVQKIAQLKEEGYSPAQIAKKLNKGVGEVSLIMNLKKR